ncbi:MAG: type II secretion system protein [Clostridiales bacterium]
MKKMVKNNKGFTLIELVIVIAILGVLAAVAITMFPKLADSSRGGADVTRATQIKSAIATYIAESGDVDASEMLGAAVNDTLVNLQDGIEVDGVTYGPYLENVGGDSDPENYLPQQDSMTTWNINVDDTTGNVIVEAE